MTRKPSVCSGGKGLEGCRQRYNVAYCLSWLYLMRQTRCRTCALPLAIAWSSFLVPELGNTASVSTINGGSVFVGRMAELMQWRLRIITRRRK